jgi:acetyl esterase/lipase
VTLALLAGSCLLAGCSRGPFPGVGPVPTLSAGQTATVTFCNNEQARITEPAVLHGAAPTAVYVHGGSWVSGDFDTGGFAIDQIGPALNAKGFVVMSVDYRLGPQNRWPAQIVDVKCAVRYLRANARALHVDRSRIGVWGQSAGGQLAALVGTAGPTAGWDVGVYAKQSSRVEAAVDLGPQHPQYRRGERLRTGYLHPASRPGRAGGPPRGARRRQPGSLRRIG